MNFYRGLPFGQVREDPAVELFVADQVNRLQKGVIIASAGCTAFSLATRPAYWTVLDGNPVQIHMCLLKQALLSTCSQEEVLEALQGSPAAAYARVTLFPDTRAYWDGRIGKIRGGLNHCGRVDRMLDALAYVYRRFLRRTGEVEAFLNLADPAVQRAILDREWQGKVWRACFHLAMANPILRWLYGPLVTAFPRGFAEIFRHQVESALCDRPAAENLYLWQLFLGRYPEGRAPYYIEHLEQLRPQLAGMEFRHSALQPWLDGQRDLNFLGLSNVLETADDEETAALCASIARAGRSGALVVLRRIIPRSHRQGAERYLRYRDDLSRTAATLESGCFCRTVEVYEVP